jgi:16S rRNA (uracil1498-N3)-methyltransferase
VRTRRAREGEEVVLFDGAGTTVRGVLARADPRGAVVEVTGPYPDREPGREVLVAASPPEAGRGDDMVAALAELGVTRYVPLLCERTPPGRAEAASRRADRWGRLALEAAKVSGRSRLLLLDPPAALADALARLRAPVLLDPDPSAPWLPSVLAPAPAPAALLVGPEGGFTDSERAQALAAGARAARISAAALRTETAAVAAAAIALAAAALPLR